MHSFSGVECTTLLRSSLGDNRVLFPLMGNGLPWLLNGLPWLLNGLPWLLNGLPWLLTTIQVFCDEYSVLTVLLDCS